MYSSHRALHSPCIALPSWWDCEAPPPARCAGACDAAQSPLSPHAAARAAVQVPKALHALLGKDAPDVGIEAVGLHYVRSMLHKVEIAMNAETDPSEMLNEIIYSTRPVRAISPLAPAPATGWPKYPLQQRSEDGWTRNNMPATRAAACMHAACSSGSREDAGCDEAVWHGCTWLHVAARSSGA